MSLEIFWFVVIAVLWIGYLTLEGFDFGVGMLLKVLGKGTDPGDTDRRRRLMLTTIGPFWDGNEVWLLTAGGAMFAAFPGWYATMFSGFYLPLLVVLVALIVRNLGFEYRHKRDDPRWKARWDAGIMIGSLLPPLILGVALTNVVRGVPIDAAGEYVGGVVALLNPIAVLGGLTLVALSLVHGCLFISMKTDGPIRADARRLAVRLGIPTAVLAVALLVSVGVGVGSIGSWIASAGAAISLVAGLLLARAGREKSAFVGTFATIALAVASYFLAMFPAVMPSTLNPDWSLTIHNVSSTAMTLKIMTVAALIFTPVMLLYTAWSYWVFRRRLRTEHIPASHSPIPLESAAPAPVEQAPAEQAGA